MQAVKKEALPRRARYYHSQIDMESLLGGAEYSELSNSYVIFICDFDPFGGGKYRYTVCDHCVELNRQKIDDGRTTIFLSTRGKNAEEVISFLEDLAPVSEELKKIIMAEQDLNILKRWLKLSAKVKSIDQFKAEM